MPRIFIGFFDAWTPWAKRRMRSSLLGHSATFSNRRPRVVYTLPLSKNLIEGDPADRGFWLHANRVQTSRLHSNVESAPTEGKHSLPLLYKRIRQTSGHNQISKKELPELVQLTN